MKVAFVTGSNKGIGFGIVEKLAKALGPSGEWDIYLTARNEELGKAAVKVLKDKGLSVLFHQLDITDCNSRNIFCKTMRSTYPSGINIAVNNAGIAYKGDSKAPFGEQAFVTLSTNFTDTIDFTEEFLPLLAQDARVVHVSSQVAHMSLQKMSDELYHKFIEPMTMIELRSLMTEFVNLAQTGDHKAHGWPDSAYGVSKVGLSKASYILGEQLKNDPRRIIMNSCCPGYVDTDMTSHKGRKTIEEGADTPFYLATLPLGVTEPINEFVAERAIKKWSNETVVTF